MHMNMLKFTLRVILKKEEYLWFPYPLAMLLKNSRAREIFQGSCTHLINNSTSFRNSKILLIFLPGNSGLVSYDSWSSSKISNTIFVWRWTSSGKTFNFQIRFPKKFSWKSRDLEKVRIFYLSKSFLTRKSDFSRFKRLNSLCKLSPSIYLALEKKPFDLKTWTQWLKIVPLP